MIRVRAGISHVLLQALDNGHCGLPREELLRRDRAAAGRRPRRGEEALGLELARRRARGRHGGRAAAACSSPASTPPSGHRRTACALAGRARPPWRRLRRRAGDPVGRGAAGARARGAAARCAAPGGVLKVLVITGGPGVGKTTLLNAILRVLGARASRPLLARRRAAQPSAWPRATGIEAKTHPPPARGGSAHRPVPTRRAPPARGRPRRRGRDVDGRRAADARAAARRAAARGPRCSSATWTSCRRSGRGRCWPTSSQRGRCRWSA